MAVPKRKHSNARTGSRRAHDGKTAKQISYCPKCGGKVIEKHSKRGYKFYGCENWPECDFVTWDKPTNRTCPQCGKALFKGKGGVLSCLAEGCGYTRKEKSKK